MYSDGVEWRDKNGRSWLWPRKDDGAWEGPWKDWLQSHSVKYFKELYNYNTCITIGANCGIHAYYYASMFKRVYAFEPSPLNFYCLNENVQFDNVWKFQLAVGDKCGFVDFNHYDTGNIGTHGVKIEEGRPVPGFFPMVSLDSMNFDSCDFLQMDAEGAEYPILVGASELIRKYKPIIVAERNATNRGVEKLMHETYHYVDIMHSCSDTIWVPYEKIT